LFFYHGERINLRMATTRRADYLTLKAYKVWEEWVFLAHPAQNRAYPRTSRRNSDLLFTTGLEYGALMLIENLVDAHLQLIQQEGLVDIIIGAHFQSLCSSVYKRIT